MNRWRDWENAVLSWLAGTATGGLVKVGLGALLAWIVASADSFDLPAWVLVVIVAVVPVVINILNPVDGRYGVNKFEFDPNAPEDDSGE